MLDNKYDSFVALVTHDEVELTYESRISHSHSAFPSSSCYRSPQRRTCWPSRPVARRRRGVQPWYCKRRPQTMWLRLWWICRHRRWPPGTWCAVDYCGVSMSTWLMAIAQCADCGAWRWWCNVPALRQPTAGAQQAAPKSVLCNHTNRADCINRCQQWSLSMSRSKERNHC